MRDIHFALVMLGLIGLTVALYLIRAMRLGRARHERVDGDGGSPLLHKSVMEIGFWLAGPLVNGLAALRFTPDTVTLFSLVPALVAAVAAGNGWFGLAAVCGAVSTLCDVLDGLLARKQGVASDAGEVVDASVDRYVEFLFLAGIAFYYRTNAVMVVLALGAIFGSFIVSYTTAKAEAMNVVPPRGIMRRAERGFYTLTAAVLTSVTHAMFSETAPFLLRELPMVLMLLIVGIATNISAPQRLAAVAGVLRARKPSGPEIPESVPTEPLVVVPAPPAQPL